MVLHFIYQVLSYILIGNIFFALTNFNYAKKLPQMLRTMLRYAMEKHYQTTKKLILKGI